MRSNRLMRVLQRHRHCVKALQGRDDQAQRMTTGSTFLLGLHLFLASSSYAAATTATFKGLMWDAVYPLNPHRGFRHQIDNSCLPGHKGQSALLEGLDTCHQLNLTTTLFYCYITPYWNVSLPASFLQDLTLRFATLREHGVSAVLNFGYEDGKTFDRDFEPYHYEIIRRHISQLTPILQTNGDVVHSLQAEPS